MASRLWRARAPRLLLVTIACALTAVPLAAQNSAAFDRGYREGSQRGVDDARRGRQFQLDRDEVYRDGDRGYDRRYGSRESYRGEFRRGFASGYRASYYGNRGDGRYNRRDNGGFGRVRGVYREPAFARGYSDGWEKGLDDARDRDRYDPMRHGDYRDADDGYERQYGSRDTYRNNYRAGFRQGYEDGYRDARGGFRREARR